MNNQTVKKEILSSADQEASSSATTYPELTQDLTPEAKFPTKEGNVITIDFQAKQRLETGLATAREQNETARIEQVRHQIATIQQHAHQGKEHLRSTTSQDIQTLDQPLRLKTISATTLHAYDIFAGKAARKAAQEQTNSQTANKTSPLDTIGKILRFGTSAGEDDTNQKAA